MCLWHPVVEMRKSGNAGSGVYERLEIRRLPESEDRNVKGAIGKKTVRYGYFEVRCHASDQMKREGLTFESFLLSCFLDFSWRDASAVRNCQESPAN